MTALPVADCPKHMQFGPCAGVADDGTCELGDRPCGFVSLIPRRWQGGPAAVAAAADAAGAAGRAVEPAPAAMRALLAERPIVVADLPAKPMSARSIGEVGAVLAGHVDAVLAGDAPQSRVQFPPAFRATLIRAAGLPVWTGLNCRDRNAVALEAELGALAVAGVSAVHCVTGDLPASGRRADAAGVFDLDSTRLAALAANAGHLVSVAGSPTAPPQEHRPARLVEKLAAGAEICFVNHCGGASPAAAFAARVRDLGGAPRFIGCVPVVTDRASAALLASFPSLVLPVGYLEHILNAADARAAGIDASVRIAAEMLEAGLDGVDLSGGPGDAGELDYAEALAEIADRLALT